jgi:hypothetical protein
MPLSQTNTVYATVWRDSLTELGERSTIALYKYKQNLFESALISPNAHTESRV